MFCAVQRGTDYGICWIIKCFNRHRWTWRLYGSIYTRVCYWNSSTAVLLKAVFMLWWCFSQRGRRASLHKRWSVLHCEDSLIMLDAATDTDVIISRFDINNCRRYFQYLEENWSSQYETRYAYCTHNIFVLYMHLRTSFFYFPILHSGRWAGIATRYGVDGPRIESGGGRDFPHPSRTNLELTQPLIQWAPGLFPGVKRLGRGVELPPASSAEGLRSL